LKGGRGGGVRIEKEWRRWEETGLGTRVWEGS